MDQNFNNIKMEPRIYVLVIFVFEPNSEGRSLKHGTLLIKETYSWLPPFCKPIRSIHPTKMAAENMVKWLLPAFRSCFLLYFDSLFLLF